MGYEVLGYVHLTGVGNVFDELCMNDFVSILFPDEIQG